MAGPFRFLQNPTGFLQLPLNDESIVLGKGRYSDVYKGIFDDGSVQNDVAVKVFKLQDAPEDALTVARNEKEVLERLNHDNVLRLSGADDSSDGHPKWLALELCNNGTIMKYISEPLSKPVPDRVALLQMAKGLNYIHGQGFAHCDLCPQNILIKTSNGTTTLKISDFGLSQQITNGSYSSTTATAHYVSPELLAIVNRRNNGGEMTLKTSSEVFVLGCIFYEYITGHNPFDESERGKFNTDAIKTMIWIYYQSKDEYCSNIVGNEAIAKVIRKMTKRIPNDRWTLEKVIRKL